MESAKGNRRGLNNAISPERMELLRGMVDDGVPYMEISRSQKVGEKTLRKHFGPSRYGKGGLAKFYNEVRRLEGRGSFAPFGDIRNPS